MPRYRYKAARPDGDIEQGKLEADSMAALAARLQESGCIPIRIAPVRGASLPRRRARRVDVETLARDLAVLLSAGLPLEQALQALQEVADTAASQRLLGALLEAVRGGASLSATMQAHGDTFTPLPVSMVRAGEAGGNLAEVLGDLAGYLERSRALRQEVLSALLYPAILVVVAMLSLFLLLAYVVPQFTGMFAELGGTLPLATRVVMAAGDLTRHYGWLVPGLALLGIWLNRWVAADPARCARRDAWLLRLPLFGSLIRRSEVARFSRTLGVLVTNGVPLLEAMRIVPGAIGNQALRQVVEAAARDLQAGRGLARPLAESGLFPGLAVRMIRVGEEAGELGPMLIKVAGIHDAEVRTAVKRLLALLEPALIIGLGVVIAGIVLSILLAILDTHQLLL
ncbi:type II secretion system F family protein [Halomonas urumqiensis]|uniref:General secretion pathway protein GspF n=1 Tax=Halomonas urumqiensis TaxID=1684789 RepID=A0A2N7UP96_9GAMM|nr:type II secretion system F family protein [Halomonas urumqiensis]PMR82251.1 general secretion pathway protein GspF [Halomonas urumqiensis]PTB02971.1 type II secretion system F family protein [Halomonas urumqiensis]GHE20912.1 type II secretion system protein F [Halomonas urumqiensis]